MDYTNRIQKAHAQLLQDTVAKQVSMSGRARPLGHLDIRDFYYKLYPSVANPTTTDFMSSSGKTFNVEKFRSNLGEEWQEIQTTRSYVLEDNMFKTHLLILAKDPGIILTIGISYKNGNAKKSRNRFERTLELVAGDRYITAEVDGKEPTTDSVTVYHPNTWDSAYSKEDILKVKEAFENSAIEESGEASIGIISCDQGEYYVKKFSLAGKTPNFTFPDLHYGEGFQEFHTSLMERVNTQTKGLVLLHGDPGTGKTQYIRVLLKELANMNKSVLYAPPSLSASLTEPEMIEFISDWVIESEKDCILLIEDAEPLLEVRNGLDGRTTGISNLLNMTDGLLNDILGLMVIATFNTELSKIDPALLRPQRLLARKMFKKVPEARAAKLAEALDMELPDIGYPASLASFYAAKQNHNVLIHDLDEERRIIGFKN
jgi:hypothetical protein